MGAARATATTTYAVFCAAELDTLNVRQRRFALGCLRELREILEERGATLSVLSGPPPAALAGAAARLRANGVFVGRAYSRRERELAEAAAQELGVGGIGLSVQRGDAVHEPEAIAELKQAPGEGYRVFPPFYDAWKTLAVQAPGPEVWPNGRDPQPGVLLDVDPLAQPVPGERAAGQRLDEFVAARIGRYVVDSHYPSRDAGSQLAPYLRFGCISPRVICHAIGQRAAKPWTLAEERVSMEAFLHRLALRDFFLHLAHFAPEVHDEALQEKMRGFDWSTDPGRARLWMEGKTGYPLVDAAMRQLRLEGRIHQRAAICAASFCCFDLGLDWRIGRDAWMRELLAADEALCDGNWQWIAGVGSDQAAYPRIYNPTRQAKLFDSKAIYITKFLPELAALPPRIAVAPAESNGGEYPAFELFAPQGYPRPVVDHESTAREFMARYRAYRER